MIYNSKETTIIAFKYLYVLQRSLFSTDEGSKRGVVATINTKAIAQMTLLHC